MIKTTNVALFFLAAGIFTSVTILSAYQILFTIPLAYYTYLAFKNKEFNLPKSAWWLLAFTLVALISLIVNFDVIPKASKNFGRLKYYLFAVCSIFVLRVWVKEVSDRTKMILTNTFFATMILAGAFMVYKAMNMTDGRVRGLTSIMRYGYGTGMILLPIIAAILQKNKIGKWFNWKLAIAAVVFGYIGMHLTQTRGALLGLLSGLPFLLYFWRPKIGLTIGGVIVLCGLGLLGNYFFSEQVNTTTNQNRLLMNRNNKSDTIRKSQWTAAIIATKEKPIFGWGLSNFHSQLKRIKNQYDLPEKDYNDAHSHNLFLETAAGTGVLGLILFVAWLATWAYEMFITGGLIRALIIPFGVGFVLSSQFEVTFDANNASMILFIYALSIALSSNQIREK